MAHKCKYSKGSTKVICDDCGVIDKALGLTEAKVVAEKHIRNETGNPNYIAVDIREVE